VHAQVDYLRPIAQTRQRNHTTNRLPSVAPSYWRSSTSTACSTARVQGPRTQSMSAPASIAVTAVTSKASRRWKISYSATRSPILRRDRRVVFRLSRAALGPGRRSLGRRRVSGLSPGLDGRVVCDALDSSRLQTSRCQRHRHICKLWCKDVVELRNIASGPMSPCSMGTILISSLSRW